MNKQMIIDKKVVWFKKATNIKNIVKMTIHESNLGIK